MPNIKLGKLARRVLLETIEKSGLDSGQGLRLTQSEEGLTLSIDNPSDTDRVIKDNNNLLIIIDREVEKIIGDAVIDVTNVNGEFKLMIMKKQADSNMH
ncbi:MAG: hypothetical protein JW954_02435 [Dehalococcoidaceae bacterium]|nr:hypothetical protein [Dehalococcoidaceae bacterium]